MIARFMMLAIVSLALAGCATTTGKVSPVNQLQNKVVDLEQRMDEQEKEVVDLKYEVKEIAGKVEAAQAVVEVETSALNPDSAKAGDVKPMKSGEDANIIRVAVSVSEIQKALKGASLYDGAIDGKIGAKTRAAIIEFQKQHSLKSDGIIGQKTWAVMKTYIPAE